MKFASRCVSSSTNDSQQFACSTNCDRNQVCRLAKSASIHHIYQVHATLAASQSVRSNQNLRNNLDKLINFLIALAPSGHSIRYLGCIFVHACLRRHRRVRCDDLRGDNTGEPYKWWPDRLPTFDLVSASPHCLGARQCAHVTGQGPTSPVHIFQTDHTINYVHKHTGLSLEASQLECT